MNAGYISVLKSIKKSQETLPMHSTTHILLLLGVLMGTFQSCEPPAVEGIFGLQVKAIPNRAVNSALTVLLRFSNTLLGSAHWIYTAKLLGLQ